MSDKKVSRQRRAKRVRMKIREQGVTRLCVNRTPRHIYAQVIAAEGDKVLATASTLEKDLREGSTGNIDAASADAASIFPVLPSRKSFSRVDAVARTLSPSAAITCA